MKASLAVFGLSRQPLSSEMPLVYISHGFKSNAGNMLQLEQRIQHLLPLATIYRFGYDWRQSVLRSGAELADTVLTNTETMRPLLLVGHSMGGLVSRVANVILADPAAFASMLPLLSYSEYRDDINPIKAFSFGSKVRRKVNGIVTLATPNSGAFLQGQLSSYLALGQLAANRLASFRHPSVQDLTTDRLFRLLQNFSTGTPLLSVSGSKVNRFSTGAGQIVRSAGKLGLSLTLPNDFVVRSEERRVGKEC